MADIINNIVGGRYYILELIGRGGSAIVYKARDIHNGGIYALKKYITSDPTNRKRLLEGMERELEVLKNCTHPVLPKIFDLIKIEDAFFLVMEYIDGIDLKKYVDEYGTLSTKMLVKVMEQVCSGFYYLHSLSPAIVYRDLKPANIILCKDGRIKLIDFGIAKRYRTDIDVDKLALGSKGFAAPEQFGDSKGKGLYNTDIRADIYGIGTTMYYLKTAKTYNSVPGSKSLYSFKDYFKTSHKLRKIIKKCTKNNPDLRYQSCIEILCSIKTLHIIGKWFILYSMKIWKNGKPMEVMNEFTGNKSKIGKV